MASTLAFRRAFEHKAFIIEDKTAEQCAQLAQTHSLEASTFVQQFELFAVNRHACLIIALHPIQLDHHACRSQQIRLL